MLHFNLNFKSEKSQGDVITFEIALSIGIGASALLLIARMVFMLM